MEYQVMQRSYYYTGDKENPWSGSPTLGLVYGTAGSAAAAVRNLTRSGWQGVRKMEREKAVQMWRRGRARVKVITIVVRDGDMSVGFYPIGQTARFHYIRREQAASYQRMWVLFGSLARKGWRMSLSEYDPTAYQLVAPGYKGIW